MLKNYLGTTWFMVRAVFFDFDGVIANSEPVHSQVGLMLHSLRCREDQKGFSSMIAKAHLLFATWGLFGHIDSLLFELSKSSSFGLFLNDFR